MRSLRSDNNAGLCPEALTAIQQANDGSHEIGYGDDSYSQRAVEAFQNIFGKDTSVWFVATGTAANNLAIASLTEPWQEVICHANSHLNYDESTAPERITHCRINAIQSESSKLTPADIEKAAVRSRGDVHQPQPGVVTISNASEFGTVYTPEEVKALCKMSHEAGYRVHVDGARFANAVAAIACDPRELANHAGVDALSFGGTKNGLAYGEAVLFFPQGDGTAFKRAIHSFPFHRKGTGHLLSKHRFVSAPFIEALRDGIWLKHAGHANAMAAKLSKGLQQLGLKVRYPTEANGVFVQLPEKIEKSLMKKGHGFYPFDMPEWKQARLMCSFDTTEDDVSAFISDVKQALCE